MIVAYHSILWSLLVAAGWITKETYTRDGTTYAVMIRRGPS